MIERSKAWEFANEWLDAWNAHDIDAIMIHYDDEIEFCSPIVQKVLAKADGIVSGKQALKDYFSRQLNRFNTLHFQLLDVFASPRSVVLYYKINRGLMAAECMILNKDMKIIQVFANYDKNDVG